MQQVTDELLLHLAEISATLIGLFLVGVFFYVESGLRRWDDARTVFEPYLRAGTRIVLILYAIPLWLSLTMIMLAPVWARLLLVVLSLVLVAANVDTVARIRAVTRATRSIALLINEVVSTIAVLALIVIPWALGGMRPNREELIWAVVLSLASGFLSTCALVMSAFDIAHTQASDAPTREPARSSDG